MGTDYSQNPSGTANSTGWTKTGGTITVTSTGIRWQGTGVFELKVHPKTSMGPGIYGYQGIRVTKNVSDAAGLKVNIRARAEDYGYYDSNGNYVDEHDGYAFRYSGPVPDCYYPLGVPVQIPASQYVYAEEITDPGTEDENFWVVFTSRGKFDYTITNVHIFGDDPTPDPAKTSGSSQFSWTQADDSLTASFKFAPTTNALAANKLEWDWRDGGPGIGGLNASNNGGVTAHTFPAPGIYNVKLTASFVEQTTINQQSDHFFDDTDIFNHDPDVYPYVEKLVTVPMGPFEARFNYLLDYPSITVNASTSLAPSRSPVQTYSWNWGDGTTGSGSQATHSYAAPGNYNVILTIYNATVQRSHSVTKTIAVTSAASTAQIEPPQFSMGLFLDDPRGILGGTFLQSEMTPLLTVDEVRWNWTRNEPSTATFKAPTDWLTSLGVDSLEDLVSDVVVRLNFGAGWVEPRSGRMVVDVVKSDPLNPQTMVEVTCVGAVATDLDGVLFTPEIIGDLYNKEEIKAGWSRIVTNSNAGMIFTQLLPVATSPGSGGPILNFTNIDFSGTVDSKGNPWLNTMTTLTIPPDATALDLLKTLVASGACDWSTQGNCLSLFNSRASGKRASGAEIPILAPGRDVNAAPQTRTLRNKTFGAVVISGKKAPWAVVDTDPNSPSYYEAHYRGLRYVAVQSAEADSSTTALAVAKPTLSGLKRTLDGELTREIEFYDDMQWIPYRDYEVGDVVYAPGPDGTLVTVSVESITLGQSSRDGITCSLILGSAFGVDPLADKVASLSGGGGISVGTVGAPPPSAKTGFIETLVSAKVTNDNGTFDAGDSLLLEGKNPTNTGTLKLGGDATSGYLQSPAVYARTVSTAGNVYVSAAGTLARSTSASKYKVSIEEADYGDSILDLRTKTWFDKSASEAWAGYLSKPEQGVPDTPNLRRHPGLIAEDVEAAGLGDFVTYDDVTGEIEGIQYERLIAALIPVVRAQRDTINDLDYRLSRLEARRDRT